MHRGGATYFAALQVAHKATSHSPQPKTGQAADQIGQSGGQIDGQSSTGEDEPLMSPGVSLAATQLFACDALGQI